jgi:hypothetical protein
MSFEEALNARLNIIRPSHQMVESCLEAHPPRLTSVLLSSSPLSDLIHRTGLTSLSSLIVSTIGGCSSTSCLEVSTR